MPKAKPFIESDPNETPADAPGINPPPGVDAQVSTTVKYTRRIDPDAQQASASELSDLEALALEADADLSPPDPLAEFLSTWGRYIGFNCEVVRLPDPADRRMASNTYARPNFGEIERLGGVPFDPHSLIQSLQFINGNSGGVFRIWLTDTAGQMIPGARLDRLALADPPGANRRFDAGQNATSGTSPVAVSAPAYKPSEIESQMQRLQTRLLETALERALNPAPPPVAPAPVPLSDEQQLATVLLTKTDLLGNVVTKLSEAMSAAEHAREATWKDKAMDFVTNNPAVAQQLTNAAERVVLGLTNLAGNFLGQPAAANQPAPPIQHAPQATPGAGTAAPPSQETVIDAEPESEDDEDMAILDELFALLTDTRELKPNDPVFIKLQSEHPIRFRLYVTMIAQLSEDQIVTTISDQSPLYASLLTGPLTKDHLRKRLTELKALCVAAVSPLPQPAPAPGPAPSDNNAPPR